MKSLLNLLLATSSFFFFSCNNHEMHTMSGDPVPVTEGSFTSPLGTPITLGANTTLTAQEISTDIIGFGNVTGLGYSANNLLGPTINVNSGTSVSINFINRLNENTNIHWHGLKIPANMDGHPENYVKTGSTFNYNFTVNQRAGLYWYHPHPDMLTGKQVFRGLAGLFIVNDAEETALKLPSGNREIPLVIQDKRISSGSIPYAPTMSEQMTGLMGQYILVNGIYAPFHNVETAKYRVRILNGSNARIYNVALSNNTSFTLIGNDGGLLTTPQTVNNLMLGPGERADLIIDFSQITLNSEVFLISKSFGGAGTAQGTQTFKIMKFKVNTEVTDNYVVPSILSSVSQLTEDMSSKTRIFDVQNTDSHMMGSMMAHNINNKTFDINRIDEYIVNGAIEVWTFDNSKGTEPHPMHLHGVQFQILSRVGGRGMLTPLESGWKDIALVLPGEKVKIIIPFTAYTGKFLYHCHNLEHEDTGMMGQFQIN